MRIALIFLSLVITTGCSNAIKTSKTSTNSNLVCDTVSATGSHMKRKRCVTPEQAEAEKLAAQDLIRNSTTGIAKTSK